jgi:phosphoribosylaminoimidazolecarboxamide formyltransferase / IMP cyclohydrolase
MTEQNDKGLCPIRRALLSVSDKTGLVEFARALSSFGVELLSTGGTAQALREAGLQVRDVADVTGFPEMLDGRIKTLHPRIHGGLLAVRDNVEHMAALNEQEIEPIDLVVINLYPFEQTVMRGGAMAEAIEQIDIGGPAMIRSAAKNYHDVAVVVAPELYSQVIHELQQNGGALSLRRRELLSRMAFARTAAYDAYIAAYLVQQAAQEQLLSQSGENASQPIGTAGSAVVLSHDSNSSELSNSVTNDPDSVPPIRTIDDWTEPPTLASWTLSKTHDLRYGENPHQQAALYQTGASGGVGAAEVLSGKEMSYTNYLDADAAWQLVCDFDETACAIIKHTNPAGVGQGATTEEAYRRALATDPVSAYGGIVAFNRVVDAATAQAVVAIFTEVVIAPGFAQAALDLFQWKKNLRVLRAGEPKPTTGLEYRQITGGMLVQTRDTHRLTRAMLKVVTKRAPTDEEIEALMFAWQVCKHTKSNAIIYARAGQTVGVGAGQMSRVDAVRIGAARAQLPVAGSVLASDAFFPFRDGIDEAAKHGITAVIQPGGSVRDEEVIAAADEHNLAMVFTGIRHFKH